MATWIRPSGSEIEMADDFDAKALKALGWKKKKAPKAPESPESPKPQADLLGGDNG